MYPSTSAAIRYYSQAGSSRGRRSATLDKTISFEHLMRLAQQGDGKAVEGLQQMAQYLGRGIAPLVSGLAPDMMVIVGGVTRAWEKVGPINKDPVRQHSFTRAETQIVPSDPITQPRLRGTIALALLNYFQAPAIASALLISRFCCGP